MLDENTVVCYPFCCWNLFPVSCFVWWFDLVVNPETFFGNTFGTTSVPNVIDLSNGKEPVLLAMAARAVVLVCGIGESTSRGSCIVLQPSPVGHPLEFCVEALDGSTLQTSRKIAPK